MTGLAEWLTAQLDAEASVANATGVASAERGWQWTRDAKIEILKFEDHDSSLPDGGLGTEGCQGCHIIAFWEEDGEHIERWNPKRVLADIAAKRAIIKLHPEVTERGHESSTQICQTCRWGAYPCSTMKALAQPYRDQPGFDPAWVIS